jgi:hypothetical protein
MSTKACALPLSMQRSFYDGAHHDKAPLARVRGIRRRKVGYFIPVPDHLTKKNTLPEEIATLNSQGLWWPQSAQLLDVRQCFFPVPLSNLSFTRHHQSSSSVLPIAYP